MKPHYETDAGVIYSGDVREVLSGLPDQSMNCCVTSPPYWGLRDYGVACQLGLETYLKEIAVPRIKRETAQIRLFA